MLLDEFEDVASPIPYRASDLNIAAAEVLTTPGSLRRRLCRRIAQIKCLFVFGLCTPAPEHPADWVIRDSAWLEKIGFQQGGFV